MIKRILILLLLSCSAAIAQPKVEKIDPFSGEATDKIKAALQSNGYRVYLPNTLVGCEIWFARNIQQKHRADAKGANYTDFVDGAFLGVITFPKGGGTDFRGQSVRAGTYTMRFQLLPNDGNHLGVAPYQDFILLIPIAGDPDPSVNLDFGKLVELSSAAARSAHPAAFEMMPPESTDASVTQTDDGWVVFHGAVESKGKKIPVSVVVKGSAAQ